MRIKKPLSPERLSSESSSQSVCIVIQSFLAVEFAEIVGIFSRLAEEIRNVVGMLGSRSQRGSLRRTSFGKGIRFEERVRFEKGIGEGSGGPRGSSLS